MFTTLLLGTLIALFAGKLLSLENKETNEKLKDLHKGVQEIKEWCYKETQKRINKRLEELKPYIKENNKDEGESNK